MWIVRVALNRPYTFVAMALAILLMGIVSIRKTPTDIFPEIDIPVISVIWTYRGLAPEEMERRVTTSTEFVSMASVNDVKNIESQTLNGVSVVKIYFHPTVSIDTAMAQVTAATQAIRFRMPPGLQPPWILRYSASSVPILQLSLSSKTIPENALYDFGQFRLRSLLAVLPGTLLPAPYGGAERQIMVDLDLAALQAKGLTPAEVSAAINAQNLMLPSGNAKMGEHDYTVSLNSSPEAVDAINSLPVRRVNGAMVYVRDVAHVRDGAAVQTSIVRQDGSRGVLVTILKRGGASTLELVDRIKREILPATRAIAPPGLEIKEMFDQSLFVRAAISGVLIEGLIAACLTAAMILLFLGSWRSTLIIAVSIPLSVLTSLIALWAMGHTLNVMTLGGLALAVGILVDDATVEIENIHRNLRRGLPLRDAILEGASQIAVPTFVSTLTICIVFVAVLFLTGPAKYLFTPMALAVVFAMAASYLLSRTLVPVMVQFLLPSEHHVTASAESPIAKLHARFEQWFEEWRRRYTEVLQSVLSRRRSSFAFATLVVASGLALVPFVGRDFFPSVDAGQFRLHVRASAGTRIESTEQLFSQVEQHIRQTIPPAEVSGVLSNIGLNLINTFNLGLGDTSTISTFDGEILVSLVPGKHAPTNDYVQKLRDDLPRRFPGVTFYFQPADIVNQILNFGLAAPINVQVVGYDRANNYRIAKQIEARMAQIPGAVDVRLHQVVSAPDLRVTVDRTRASELGLTQQDVANDLLVSLSSSAQVSPSYWVDPKIGIPYMVAVQTPQRDITNLNDLASTPVAASGLASPQLLANVAAIERRTSPAVVNHLNAQPVFDIYAGVQGRDLGAVARDVREMLDEFRSKLPPGTNLLIRGQVESMDEAFRGLALGLLAAAALVYLLMVVNFQSWLEPLIILSALPGALCGIVWMLFVTQTTLSVPSLMGAIMAVGVATANSILIVTFARDEQRSGVDVVTAVLNAGSTRLRPILMTALAMIIGMLPMALGMGEGGEQNAPLGRAVIGGLAMATAATLLFVPLVYTAIRGRTSQQLKEEN